MEFLLFELLYINYIREVGKIYNFNCWYRVACVMWPKCVAWQRALLKACGRILSKLPMIHTRFTLRSYTSIRHFPVKIGNAQTLTCAASRSAGLYNLILQPHGRRRRNHRITKLLTFKPDLLIHLMIPVKKKKLEPACNKKMGLMLKMRKNHKVSQPDT